VRRRSISSSTGSISLPKLDEDDVEQGLEFIRGLEESTATSISVMLSGARREKEASDGLTLQTQAQLGK
jgi:hypothetical protein